MSQQVLGYACRALNKPERNYCVIRRELLGLIFGVRKFWAYLAGVRFTIRKDHSVLRWLLDAKEPEGQMARWIQVLGTYEFQVLHQDQDGWWDMCPRQRLDERVGKCFGALEWHGVPYIGQLTLLQN